MNHIALVKHLYNALLKVKNLIAEVASNTLGAIQEIEQNFALKPKIRTVNLTVADWSGTSAPYTQTVSVEGAIPDEDMQIIKSSPSPTESNINETISCGIYCTGQGNGTLTFTAFNNKPTEQITFNIKIQDL